jgi:hypothetical protein
MFSKVAQIQNFKEPSFIRGRKLPARTYKNLIMADPVLAALKIDASKVKAANAAATMTIYG